MHQELREREDVEKELGLVKGWIQDTRGLLLSPTADLESLLQELEVRATTFTLLPYHVIEKTVICIKSSAVVRVTDCTR